MSDRNNYYIKYLKYKQKYLKLKGGVNEIILNDFNTNIDKPSFTNIDCFKNSIPNITICTNRIKLLKNYNLNGKKLSDFNKKDNIDYSNVNLNCFLNSKSTLTNNAQIIACFKKSDIIRNIVCYNLSWATQFDKPLGSEWKFVTKCKEIKIQAETILHNEGIFRDKTKFPNVCTQIGLEGLIDYNNNIGIIDLIGFQECHYQGFGYKDDNNNFMSNNVLNYLNNKMNDINYDCVFSKPSIIQKLNQEASINNVRNYNAIFFNKNMFNLVNQDNNTIYIDPLQMITLKKKSNEKHYIIINWHASHKKDHTYRTDMFSIMNKYISTMNNINPIRIIVMGDFNDKTISEYNINFTNFTKNLTLKGLDKNSKIKSCCWKSYRIAGDYIFDSEPKKHFGIMDNFITIGTGNNSPIWRPRDRMRNLNTYFGSDHLPVVARYTKRIAYDFDGVLHRYVKKLPDKNGQIHPINLDLVNLKKYRFSKVIDTIHNNYYQQYELYIVTAQPISKKYYIKKYLDEYCPEMFKDNKIICYDTPIKRELYKNKADKLKVLRINEFYEDSCNNINKIWEAKKKNELPDLTHLYVCNPFNEKRPFENHDTLRPSDIEIPKHDFIDVIDLNKYPCLKSQ